MERKESFILIVFVLIAFFLRFYPIPDNLFFGPEQGRDALVAKDIIQNHRFTLLGPKTDIEGIYHGPLYYYIISLPYALFHGNPVGLAFFFILINSFSTVLLFKLGKNLFSKPVGYISALFFVFSPEAIVYSRWLSNASLVPFFSLLFIYSLFKISQKNFRFLPLVALFSGILIQLQLLNSLFTILLFFITVVIIRPKPPFKFILLSIGLFLLLLSTFILFDLRHDFLTLQALIKHFTHGEYTSAFSSSILEASTRFSEEVVRFLSPHLFMISSFLFILGILTSLPHFLKRFNSYTILILWLFLPVVFLAFSRHSVLNHFFLFSSYAIFLLVAVAIIHLKSYGKFLPVFTIIIIVIFNIYSITTLKPWGITIKQEKQIIDSIYQTSMNKDFRFEAFTIPYFWPDAWKYMFSWYGEPKYGHRINENSPRFVYFIWEDDSSAYQKYWLNNHVAEYKTTEMETTFDKVHVERREEFGKNY